jgi:hypothetical protein
MCKSQTLPVRLHIWDGRKALDVTLIVSYWCSYMLPAHLGRVVFSVGFLHASYLFCNRQ